MLRALFVLLLPSSGNGIRRRNQLWALITPHRQINKYLIWTPKSDFIILLMGLKCFFQTRQYLRTMFLQKDYPEKKIVCTSDENMRTHEQNSKIAFVINLYKLRKFFGKQYRERKKKTCNLRKLKLYRVRFARYLQYTISGTEIGGKEHPPTRTQLHQHFYSSLLITNTRLVRNNIF